MVIVGSCEKLIDLCHVPLHFDPPLTCTYNISRVILSYILMYYIFIIKTSVKEYIAVDSRRSVSQKFAERVPRSLRHSPVFWEETRRRILLTKFY